MHCAPIGDVANEVSYVAVGAQCIYMNLFLNRYVINTCMFKTNLCFSVNYDYTKFCLYNRS